MLVICDIDGTVANLDHRIKFVRSMPKNWSAFNLAIPHDKPIDHTILIIRSLKVLGCDIVFASGRSEDTRESTTKWLMKYVLPEPILYMRATGDFRKDSIVKKEILDQIRIEHGEPDMVFDDRKQVVDMWIEEGIFVFDVGQGEGEF